MYLSGDLDANSVQKMDTEMEGILKDKYNNIIFNFNDLTYISSAGLGIFISYKDNFEALNSKLILCNMQPNVYAPFEMLGLHQIFTILPTEEDAKNELQCESTM